MMLSPVQTERLFAANTSRVQTETALDALKGDHTEAKKLRDERQAGLLDALEEVQKAHDDGKVPPDEQRAVFKLQKDYRRALNAFELKDREKRRTEDQAKKLTARVLQIIEEAQEGPDLFAGKAGPDDKLAWRMVELADLVESQLSAPFRENDVHNVGDFLKAWEQGDLDRLVKGKKLDVQLMRYVGTQVRGFLEARKIAPAEVPPTLRGLKAVTQYTGPMPEEKAQGELEDEPKPGPTGVAPLASGGGGGGSFPPKLDLNGHAATTRMDQEEAEAKPDGKAGSKPKTGPRGKPAAKPAKAHAPSGRKPPKGKR